MTADSSLRSVLVLRGVCRGGLGAESLGAAESLFRVQPRSGLGLKPCVFLDFRSLRSRFDDTIRRAPIWGPPGPRVRRLPYTRLSGTPRAFVRMGHNDLFGRRPGGSESGASGECPERQRGRTVNPLRKLRRFESCFPHHALMKTGTDRTSRRPVAEVSTPCGAGPTQSPCGYSTMVVQQPSKLNMSVRFRLPAPDFYS